MSDPNTATVENPPTRSVGPAAPMRGQSKCRLSRLASLAQLQAFVVAADHGSFTKAAGALGISQPAISELVRRLESDLDVQLIRRRGGVFVITPAGERLLPHASQAVTSAQAGFDAVR